MTRFILARIPVLFFILFITGSGVALAYQHFYITPGKQCEEKGKWWAAKWRACVTPIEIEKLTGRPNTAKLATPEEAAAAAAAAPQP